jgi:hypothetical protein
MENVIHPKFFNFSLTISVFLGVNFTSCWQRKMEVWIIQRIACWKQWATLWGKTFLNHHIKTIVQPCCQNKWGILRFSTFLLTCSQISLCHHVDDRQPTYLTNLKNKNVALTILFYQLFQIFIMTWMEGNTFFFSFFGFSQ